MFDAEFSGLIIRGEGPSHEDLRAEAAYDLGAPSAPIVFGAFLVAPAARTVLRDGAPVDLGGRAFDLLMSLLEARGRIVSKAEIMDRVWPGLAVEETNLRVQLSRLRQALGDERWRIKTIQCRGYMLVMDPPVARLSVDQRPAEVRASEPAVVIIDADGESREQLRRLLLDAGVRVEGLASLVGLLQPQATAP
jgi:DNA-binding winged helix-turn-helix (wHTH) protein